MEINRNIIRSLAQKISKTNILIFDLDGTIVNSDEANFLAYADATNVTLGMDIVKTCTDQERFTRQRLKKIIPGLSNSNFERIVQLKEQIFPSYLHMTREITCVTHIIRTFFQTCTVVLSTNSSEYRANITLVHHGLFNIFNHRFYRTDPSRSTENKYIHAITVLNTNPSLCFAFEDDPAEIQAAISAGIPQVNIIHIPRKGWQDE